MFRNEYRKSKTFITLNRVLGDKPVYPKLIPKCEGGVRSDAGQYRITIPYWLAPCESRKLSLSILQTPYYYFERTTFSLMTFPGSL